MTLYALPGCAKCRQAREFLVRHRVRFEEVNVLLKPRSLTRILPRMRQIFPVIAVGALTLSGFNHRRWTAALRLGAKPRAGNPSGPSARRSKAGSTPPRGFGR